MELASPFRVYWTCLFLFGSGMAVPFLKRGVSSSNLSSDEMVYPSSGGTSEGAPTWTGGSAVPYGSLNPRAGAPSYQGLANWNMGPQFQGNGDNFRMAGFYPQVDSFGGLVPQSEGYDMQGPPQGVSEPYPATFVVQSGGGYKRARLSGTKDRYSAYPLSDFEPQWSTDQRPSSSKG